MSLLVAAFPGDLLSPGSMIPLAVAVLGVSLLMYSLRRKLHRRQTEPHPRPSDRASSPARQGGEFRRDVENAVVHLEELSRQISAEIDTRHARLEAAIRDADRRIAALQRLSRQAAQRAGDSAAGAEDVDVDVREAVVHELADAGLSAIEIARDTGKTPGEVELILNLRRQTAADPDKSAP